MSKERRILYSDRAVARSVARRLSIMINKAWERVTHIFLTQGERESQEVEQALHFLEGIMEECKLLGSY